MKLKMNKDVCMFPNKKRKNYIKKISNINSCDKITFCLLFPVYTVICFLKTVSFWFPTKHMEHKLL